MEQGDRVVAAGQSGGQSQGLAVIGFVVIQEDGDFFEARGAGLAWPGQLGDGEGQAALPDPASEGGQSGGLDAGQGGRTVQGLVIVGAEGGFVTGFEPGVPERAIDQVDCLVEEKKFQPPGGGEAAVREILPVVRRGRVEMCAGDEQRDGLERMSHQ